MTRGAGADRTSARSVCLLASLLLFCMFRVPNAFAFTGAFAGQRGDSALSDAEIEELREAAYVPADRIGVFIKLLDARARSIQDLAAKPHRPGREDDMHDLFEQFSSIADELNDNLDDYGPRHRDLRKELPKLLQATDRWNTALRTPADSEGYNVARKLALEGVSDIRDETTRLVEDQRTYFAAHPEAAKAEKESAETGNRPVK